MPNSPKIIQLFSELQSLIVCECHEPMPVHLVSCSCLRLISASQLRAAIDPKTSAQFYLQTTALTHYVDSCIICLEARKVWIFLFADVDLPICRDAQIGEDLVG